MNLPPLKNGPWLLEDLKTIEKNGLKVFSCFHCGGGSSFGYKLAGFDVIGGVDIDPDMMRLYRANHNPRNSYLMGVAEFNAIPDSKLPSELFDIDILDGSPPCSSFSMAGSREDAWGESKKFREGQAEQVLDDLFFHFVKTATKLRPKVVVAENVKGLIMGNARGYVKEIFEAFRKAGYETQLFLLNASRMGVPQARERTFFVARRIDLKLPKLTLDFNEPVILVGMALDGVNRFGKKLNPGKIYNDWRQTPEGNGFGVVGGFNSQKKLSSKQVSFTQCATGRHLNWDQPCFLSDLAVQRLQSFPDDYNFLDQDAGYVCGMSVPPFMMQRVATDIAKQLF